MRSLQSTSLALGIVAGLLAVPVVSYAEDGAVQGDKGKRYDAEWKTLPALESGYEVVRLTSDDAMDNKMYLDVNPYVPALDSVVFMSDRDDGKENLYLMSLKDGSFVQLTDSGDMDGDHANVSPATEEAFFRDGKTIKKVGLHEPYEETTIHTVEDKYQIKGIMSLTSNGATIALSLHDEGENKSALVTIDAKTGNREEVARVEGKVDHVLIKPDGAQLLYHVNDKDIIGLVDVDSKETEILTDSDEEGVHPFWAADGQTAAYAQRGKDGGPKKVATYDTRSGEYVKYNLDDSNNHFAMNASQNVIQGDGSKEERYIYYYSIEPGDNTPDGKKMFEHGSSSESELVHPHAAFINDTDLIFNSDLAGNGDAYLLRKV